MIIGLIAFAATFLLPLAWMAFSSTSYVRALDHHSERHANERIEQQGLGAVVTKLELGAPVEQKRAA